MRPNRLERYTCAARSGVGGARSSQSAAMTAHTSQAGGRRIAAGRSAGAEGVDTGTGGGGRDPLTHNPAGRYGLQRGEVARMRPRLKSMPTWAVPADRSRTRVQSPGAGSTQPVPRSSCQ